MPVSWDIDDDAGLIRTVITGHVLATEYFEYFRATAADPRYRPGMDRLLIAYDILSFPSAAEIQRIAMEARARDTKASFGRIAIVVNNALGAGMINMTMIQAGMDDRFENFPDEASARAWLAAGKTNET